MADPFTFELVSPENLLVSGAAIEVLVPGTEGYFTVLSNHAPVMSTVKPGVVEAKMASGDHARYFVRGGFVDVTPDGCTLLAEYATNVEDIDIGVLDQQIKNAEEDVGDADSGPKRDKAQLALDQLREVRTALA